MRKGIHIVNLNEAKKVYVTILIRIL